MNFKERAWLLFDRIVADAETAAEGQPDSTPWTIVAGSLPRYVPDIRTLERLLGVPLLLRANTQSGVPALALDVWLGYELRRAGFDKDAVWPRPTVPRVLPVTVANLLKGLPRNERDLIRRRLERDSIPGVSSSTANVLGKNYTKQVDVGLSDWWTGPELLISTKRMDSSFGKNAPNRIEESYGDAKNLRLRHPLASLGFVFGLRTTIVESEPTVYEKLTDLVGKLGREDDAYHATCIVMIDYGDQSDVNGGENVRPEHALVPIDQGGNVDDVANSSRLSRESIELDLARLPEVAIHDVAEKLSPGRLLAILVQRVLEITPVDLHRAARAKLALARAQQSME